MLALLLLAAALQSMEHHHHEMSPYADRTAQPIKALTQETLDAYRNGTGAGMAVAAELNGYPGPRHILDLASELNLSADQKSRVQAIYDQMHADAVRTGREIIDREKSLDDAFAHGTATDADVKKLTSEIAVLQGKLRYTHLAAHLEAKSLLTAAQIDAYRRARGYAK